MALVARPPARHSGTSVAQSAAMVVFLGTALISLGGFVFEGRFNFLIIAVIALYLAVESRNYLRKTDAFGVLAPPFLASIMHFSFAYLLPSVATLIDPWIQSRFETYLRSFENDIAKALALSGVAAFCMWRGYYFGQRQARSLRRRLEGLPALRQEFEPNVAAAFAIQGLYFATVSYSLSIGVFGVSSTSEARDANIAFLFILSTGLAAGSLSFLLLMVLLFRRLKAGESAILLRVVCTGIVLLHLLTGAMSGFKSQIVMPFVMIVLAKFLATHRISWGYVLGGFVALIVAYQVIEPYREFLTRESAHGRSNASSVIENLQKAYAQRELGHQSEAPLGSQIAQRFDLTTMTAIGIAFSDSNPLGAEKGTELAETLYLAPILAFVPRALWADKSTYSTGAWFNTVVLGSADTGTAVGMGPIAWLYLVGGVAGVMLGFFGVGWAQAMLFDGFARAGAGGIIVFLAAANSLVMIPTEFGPVIVGVLRLLPIAFVAQWILLQPAGRTWRSR